MKQKNKHFIDLFGEDIHLGNWLHLAKCDNSPGLRFGEVVGVGSTGKILLRVHCFDGYFGNWSVNSRSIAYDKPHKLAWKVPYASLPQSLRNILELPK